MSVLRQREVKAFSEGVHRIHQAMDLATFPQRIFEIVDDLFSGVFITVQEMNARSGVARNSTSLPTPEGFMERNAELVLREHPVVPVAMAGERNAMRVSDFRTFRQFRRTALYNESFRPLGVKHQVVIPLVVPHHVAGITISRDKDFSDEEVCLLNLLAPHIGLAHVHAQRFSEMQDLRSRPVPEAEALRVLGLTPREAEVMHWIIQGKRDAEIAQILGCSPRTIEKHVQRLLEKLGVENRTAAALEASRQIAARGPIAP